MADSSDKSTPPSPGPSRLEPGMILSGERPLPHNEEAEIAVLGSMMLDPDEAADIANARLAFEGSFSNPNHRIIFDALVEIAPQYKGAAGIDLLTLSDYLNRKKLLDRVGGLPYLARILNSVPSAANIEHYVDIVYEHAVLRRLIDVGAKIVNEAFKQEKPVRDLLDEVEERILGIAELQHEEAAVSVNDAVMQAVDLLDKLHRHDPSVMGIPSGFPDLDKKITGFRAGEMIVLAARPSIGKTALALNLACNAAMARENPVPVGIFSLEMGTDLLVLRLICSLAKVNLTDIRDGAVSNARWQEILGWAGKLKKTEIYIDDTGGLDIEDLRHRARQMWRKHKIKLLIIDYLQLLRMSTDNRNYTRENEVSRISARLKSLAKELAIPIIVLAQLNRQAEQAGQKPRLAHLRESGAIEQDADIVMLLHRDRDVQKDNHHIDEGMDAELIVAKHRNGPTGAVPLTFFPAYAKFESRAMIPANATPNTEQQPATNYPGPEAQSPESSAEAPETPAEQIPF